MDKLDEKVSQRVRSIEADTITLEEIDSEVGHNI